MNELATVSMMEVIPSKSVFQLVYAYVVNGITSFSNVGLPLSVFRGSPSVRAV